MAGHSSLMLGWSLTYLSVLGSQLFGQASAESCGVEGQFGFGKCTGSYYLKVFFFAYWRGNISGAGPCAGTS